MAIIQAIAASVLDAPLNCSFQAPLARLPLNRATWPMCPVMLVVRPMKYITILLILCSTSFALENSPEIRVVPSYEFTIQPKLPDGSTINASTVDAIDIISIISDDLDVTHRVVPHSRHYSPETFIPPPEKIIFKTHMGENEIWFYTPNETSGTYKVFAIKRDSKNITIKYKIKFKDANGKLGISQELIAKFNIG